MDNNNPAPIAVAPATPAKSGKGAVIGMVICSILAIAGVGFGVYEMMNKPTQDLKVQVKGADGEITAIDTGIIEKANDGKTVTINGSVSSVSLKELKATIDKYVDFDADGMNIFEKGFTDEYKYVTAIKKVLPATAEFVAEYDFTYNQLNEAYHNLFGTADDVENITDTSVIPCGTPIYSAELGKYIQPGDGCGGWFTTIRSYDILDFSESNGKITAKVAYLDVYPGDDTSSVKLKLDNGEYATSGPGVLDTRKFVDQLPKYSFTFEKSGADYILTAFQKI